MNYIAHIRESDHMHQSVEEHLLGVKELAERIGDKIGIKHITGLAGVLHDLGKFTDEFREYILEAINNPEAPPKRGSVDHSTAGGKLLYNLLHTGQSRDKGLLAEVVGNAIISHHSYLQDFLNQQLESNYLNRVCDKQLDQFDTAVERFYTNVMNELDLITYVEQAALELENYMKLDYSATSENKLMFLTKFVFSALIDADRTNTRCFEENKLDALSSCPDNIFHTYYDRLMRTIRSFDEGDNADTPINRLRKTMSEQCDQFSENPSGIYTLSIPTGGGKTLASLRYGLRHSMLYNKQRIIYVVPYTTIIEQNAEEVRKSLRDDGHILEHHSNVVDDVNDDDEDQDGILSNAQKLKLAKDNWDTPIIFTTMVQFLDVFYAKGSRNIRRLHNLSESVIIFDEVQKVPIPCISLFNHALNFLKTYGRSSLVLCTATQPALDFVEHKLQVNTDGEMIKDLDIVIEAFKRVSIIDHATDEAMDNNELCDLVGSKIEELQSVLVILNTKTVVKKMYLQLKSILSDVPVYQLSTSMCAAHRNEILADIREHLKREEKVVCISTQLIEAGVDVSFECVIRSLAGLDSIAQAAGRCNRHGEHELRHVYVIDHEEENLSRLKEISRGKEISRKILLDLKRDPNAHGGHLLSMEAMERYFVDFYSKFESDLDYALPKLGSDISEVSLLMAAPVNNPFFQSYWSKFKQRPPLYLTNSYKTAAEHFRVIDQTTTTVIAPYDDVAKEIIAELNGEMKIEDLTRVLRSAQKYTVNLYDNELHQLSSNRGVEGCMDGKILVLKESAYNKEYGLDVGNDSGFEEAIF